MSRIFVAGSINMDVVATAERHPRIGETVAGMAVLYFPGGKGANQAVAAARLGAPTTLIGRLGKDAFGEELKTFLTAQGVDLTFVRQTAEAHTGTALITVAETDNTIVVVPGANALVDADDVAAATLAKGDIAVSQFEIPLPAIAAFFHPPVPQARQRSSIRRPPSPSALNCSISSIFSFSMKANSACLQRPCFAPATRMRVSSTRRGLCKAAAPKSFA